MQRRKFLKSMGIAAGVVLTSGLADAGDAKEDVDPYSILVDTTRCGGCRSCEAACASANGLPMPDTNDDSDLEHERSTSEHQWTVVNRFEDEEVGEIFVKRQCMHCLRPACASACLTRAMLKTEEGPVIWRESKCMGCRYCMVSCPFNGPKFEYDSPVPKIQKCRMCWERLVEGEKPACVANCSAEGDALVFGRRSEVLKIARQRIAEDPDEYVDHIYGEHEVGGTGWLYLAAVPFEKLGFRTDLGTTAYPEYTKGFLYSVPVVLTLWPAFLLALNRATDGVGAAAKGERS
jgi:formate dehydrogenase iron-sulfur subunit